MNIIWCYFVIAFIMSCSSNKRNDAVIEKDSITVAEKENATILYKRAHRPHIFVSDDRLRDVLYKMIDDNLQKGRIRDRDYCPESIVLGHLEEDTIVGNFDGKGVDILYIDSEECGCKNNASCKHAHEYESIRYYLVSKSGRLPKIRLFAADYMPPRIVNEGDLDGDGKSEIGYMYTWVTSNWRCYRILSFHKGEWRYLVDPNEEYMVTSRAFRFSGHEIAERGKEKGTVLFHYLPDGFNQNVCDTIVRPTYVKIDDI